MDNVIDNVIQISIPEIKYHLDELLYSDPLTVVRQYTIPEIGIKQIEQINDHSIGLVDIYLQKENMNPDAMETPSQIIKKPNKENYWTWVLNQIQDPDINLTDKAVNLIELRDNLNSNFSKRDPQNTNKVIKNITSLINILKQEITEQKEKTYFPINPDTIIEKPITWKHKFKTLDIVDLLPSLFFDTQKYTQIEEHTEDNSFSRGRSLRLRVSRQLIYTL
ncbi:hypothetical protein GF358_04665 [Candidatus Woesearchaeota archaeon]|nr:hypothetical protein [Candidatus Woesearchaeota archaeon]